MGGATIGEIEGAALKDLAATKHWLRNNEFQPNTNKMQSLFCTLGCTQAATHTTQIKLLGFDNDKRLN